jgi:hypothetical protein
MEGGSFPHSRPFRKSREKAVVGQFEICQGETVLSKAIQVHGDNGVAHDSDKKTSVIREAAIMRFVYPDLGIEDANK